MTTVYRKACLVLTLLLPACKPTTSPEGPATTPPVKTDSSVAPTPSKTDAAHEKPSSNSAQPDDKRPLLDVLCELPVWRASRDFTAQEWDQLVAAARRIQSSNPADVRAALDKSPHCGPTMNLDVIPLEFLPTSKEFILLRIAFDVPETVPPEYPNKFWLRSADAPWTVSWPLRWRNGRPEQLARFAGFEGFAYIPAGEWDYFKAEFPFRKLPPP